MEIAKRKSTLGMMLVVGGLAAAVPAVSVADPRPTTPGKPGVVQCDGKPQAPAQGTTSKPGAVQCDGKPQAGAAQKNKGFFCNLAPKTSQKNKGFFCNLAPKTAPKDKAATAPETKTN